MELDVPMMEIGYAFGKTLDAPRRKKTLSPEARTLGARWLRGRIESSPILRWNPVRRRSLELTRAVAADAIANSAGDEITPAELAASIRKLGVPDGYGKIRLDDCPF
jgi:hypothetical protein